MAEASSLLGVEPSRVGGHRRSDSLPSSQRPMEAGAVVTPVFQERKLRPREAKRRAQGHTADRPQSQDLNPESMLLAPTLS